jgi:hypothetical protein
VTFVEESIFSVRTNPLSDHNAQHKPHSRGFGMGLAFA